MKQKRSKRLSLPVSPEIESELVEVADKLGEGFTATNSASLALRLGLPLLRTLYLGDPLPPAWVGRFSPPVELPIGRGRPAHEQAAEDEALMAIEIPGSEEPPPEYEATERPLEPSDGLVFVDGVEYSKEDAPAKTPQMRPHAKPEQRRTGVRLEAVRPEIDRAPPDPLKPQAWSPDEPNDDPSWADGDRTQAMIDRRKRLGGEPTEPVAGDEPKQAPEPSNEPVATNVKDALAELLEQGVPIEEAYRQAREATRVAPEPSNDGAPTQEQRPIDPFSCSHGVRLDSPSPCEGCASEGF